MSTPAESTYLLSWKGVRSGPFSLEQIRAQLAAGEISRVHRIGVGGGWPLLDEFLAQLRDPVAERHAAEMREREARLREEFAAELAAERTRLTPPAPAADPEPASPLSHLLPKEPPPPNFQPAPPIFDEVPASSPTRTSGLAIASLVMALCNFIPFVGFFSWILALVFGHTALSQMKRDPGLGGRHMAIVGLAITYFLLVVGLTFILLLLLNNQPLPSYLRP